MGLGNSHRIERRGGNKGKGWRGLSTPGCSGLGDLRLWSVKQRVYAEPGARQWSTAAEGALEYLHGKTTAVSCVGNTVGPERGGHRVKTIDEQVIWACPLTIHSRRRS